MKKNSNIELIVIYRAFNLVGPSVPKKENGNWDPLTQ